MPARLRTPPGCSPALTCATTRSEMRVPQVRQNAVKATEKNTAKPTVPQLTPAGEANPRTTLKITHARMSFTA